MCGVSAAQRTWVVDQFGTGDFTDIPPAVAAAAPRDTIIVDRDRHGVRLPPRRPRDVMVGIPTAPIPTAWRTLWMLPAPTVVVAAGMADLRGTLRGTLALPRNLPTGITFASQAVELVAGNQLVLSDPYFPVVWW